MASLKLVGDTPLRQLTITQTLVYFAETMRRSRTQINTQQLTCLYVKGCHRFPVLDADSGRYADTLTDYTELGKSL